MPVVDVIDKSGAKIAEIELLNEIFNVPIKKHILHEVVKMQLNNRRSGTASVKNRSDVRGSGRKLYRQKGTGNARPGDIKSPLRRGGGVIFGPKPKNYTYKVPKKVRKQALKIALTSKYLEKSLVVLNNFDLESLKTKLFVEIINNIDNNCDSFLIITNDDNRNLELASRNLKKIKVLRSEGLNVYDILKYNKLIILEKAIEKINKRLEA